MERSQIASVMTSELRPEGSEERSLVGGLPREELCQQRSWAEEGKETVCPWG